MRVGDEVRSTAYMTFISSSTLLFPLDALGAATSDELRERGLELDVEAGSHNLDELVVLVAGYLALAR